MENPVRISSSGASSFNSSNYYVDTQVLCTEVSFSFSESVFVIDDIQ
jgi:hypothetical protein